MTNVPDLPKIYHIVHVDRLSSIVADGFFWCDRDVGRRHSSGTVIGINAIKERRLRLCLTSHPDLHVGECVPFYFCPRSPMLYVIYMTNHPDLAYKDGQDSIIHLEADFYASIEWATKNVKRWVFTTSNAGSNFFEDYCDPNQLTKIDWDAVQAIIWASCREKKQAEFLVENAFPWHLIERIGVYSQTIYKQVANTLLINGHRPPVEVIQSWYY